MFKYNCLEGLSLLIIVAVVVDRYCRSHLFTHRHSTQQPPEDFQYLLILRTDNASTSPPITHYIPKENPQQHGQTHKKPLGPPHHPHRRRLYVFYPTFPPSPHLQLTLSFSTDQVAASIAGFFWPKLFWDFLTTNLDSAVRPIPILQILNLLFGLLGLCWEWPLPLFTTAAHRMIIPSSSPSNTHNTNNNLKPSPYHKPTTSSLSTTTTTTNPPHPPKVTILLAAMHSSIEARLLIYPLSTLAALLLYQATNAGLYYIIGMCVYFWGFSEGEVVMGTPWTLPKKSSGARGRPRGASRV